MFNIVEVDNIKNDCYGNVNVNSKSISTLKAYTKIYVKDAGNSGDTITISITDISNLVITLTSLQQNSELELTKLIVTTFNSSINHNTIWIAYPHKEGNRYYVYIIAIDEGCYSEKENFSIITTGTTIIETIFEDIKIRPSNEIAIFNSSHKNQIIPKVNTEYKEPYNISYSFNRYLLNGTSNVMNVNGSTTPIDFVIYPENNKDMYITNIKLILIDNLYRLDRFMGLNSLTNGILFRIKSSDITRDGMINLKTNMDIATIFCNNPSNYFLYSDPNGYYVIAVNNFVNPILLKRAGAYQYNDYLLIRIQDDLTGLTQFNTIVLGYEEEIL